MPNDKSIGIIANPASGKDIRRMISYAVSVDNTDKVRIVQQIILSACTMGIKKIYYMPEYYGIFITAFEEISLNHRDIMKELEIIPTHEEIIGNQEDTIIATKKMKEESVDCILTLGGDGTNRVVAKYCERVPLIPISTGTNNVFPENIQGTIAGAVAGIFSRYSLNENDRFIKKTKRIEFWNEEELMDIALIDAVIIDDIKTASRAMWDTLDYKQVFLTSCTLDSIGISSMGSMLQEIEKDESRAIYLEFDSDASNCIHFPITPGVYTKAEYSNWKLLEIEEAIEVSTIPCVIALDGEKDLYIKPGTTLEMKVTWNGPRLVDTRAVLKETRVHHTLQSTEY